MLLKRVGHALLFKTRLHKLIPCLSPLLILASFALIVLVPHIREPYQFQQPALRTKLHTLALHNSLTADYSMDYLPGLHFGDRVKVAVLGGRLREETVLLVAGCGPGEQLLRRVHYEITGSLGQDGRTLAKNVGLLCYANKEDLVEFITEYTQGRGASRYRQHLGIIRTALVVNLQGNTTHSGSPLLSNPPVTISPRVYFNTYSAGSPLLADVDYYQSVKQLLQQSGLTKWQPCQAIHSNPIMNSILRLVARVWRSQLWFAKHGLCQLSEVLSTAGQSINSGFQSNGIQAGTIDIVAATQGSQKQNTQTMDKIVRVAVSFLEEYVVLEDHLHSSATLYMPVSEREYVPLKGLLLPGLVFVVGAACLLINRAVLLFQQKLSDDSSEVASGGSEAGEGTVGTASIKGNGLEMLGLLIYTSSAQYHFLDSTLYSIPVAWLLGEILRLPPLSPLALRILLPGLYVMLCLYHSIFCFPGSFLCMLATAVVCLRSKEVAVGVLAVAAALWGWAGGSGLGMLGQMCLWGVLVLALQRADGQETGSNDCSSRSIKRQ